MLMNVVCLWCCYTPDSEYQKMVIKFLKSIML